MGAGFQLAETQVTEWTTSWVEGAVAGGLGGATVGVGIREGLGLLIGLGIGAAVGAIGGSLKPKVIQAFEAQRNLFVEGGCSSYGSRLREPLRPFHGRRPGADRNL